MNAAQSPPEITDPETVRQWAAYEAKGRSARLQYEAYPTATGFLGILTTCVCGRRTQSTDGVCRKCRS